MSEAFVNSSISMLSAPAVLSRRLRSTSRSGAIFPETLDRPITDASEYSVRPAGPPPLLESHPPRLVRAIVRGSVPCQAEYRYRRPVSRPVPGRVRPLPPGGGHVQGTGNAPPDPGDLGASGPGLDRLRAVARGRVPAGAGRPAARPWLPARTACPA